MSVENAREFIEKIKSDGEFSNQINEAKTQEARMQIVKSAGLEFTEEEYKTVTSKLPNWTMDEWLAARRVYDEYETSWLAGELSPWRSDLKVVD